MIDHLLTRDTLLAECKTHGIRLELAGNGMLTIDAPRGTLTPELRDRLKAHKGDLLEALEQTQEHAALLEFDAGLSRHEVERLASINDVPDCDLPTDSASDRLCPEDWLANSIDPDELTPCSKCGTLELWESATDDLLGLTTGQWRCMKCDPPRLVSDWRKR